MYESFEGSEARSRPLNVLLIAGEGEGQDILTMGTPEPASLTHFEKRKGGARRERYHGVEL